MTRKTREERKLIDKGYAIGYETALEEDVSPLRARVAELEAERDRIAGRAFRAFQYLPTVPGDALEWVDHNIDVHVIRVADEYAIMREQVAAARAEAERLREQADREWSEHQATMARCERLREERDAERATINEWAAALPTNGPQESFLTKRDNDRLRAEAERLREERDAAVVKWNDAADAAVGGTRVSAALRSRCERLEGALAAGFVLKDGRAWIRSGGDVPIPMGGKRERIVRAALSEEGTQAERGGGDV